MTDYAYPASAYQPQRNDDLGLLAKVILIGIGVLVFSWALTRGLDTTFENQDRMNCRSAKVSGNEEWLGKCQCYYDGQPISCIQTYDRK